MSNKLQHSWRSHAIFATAALLLVSLFVSRALLSISGMVLIGMFCIHSQVGMQWRRFLNTPVLWGMALLFLFPLLTGAWSDNQEAWGKMLRIKLPLLFFPFAFASPYFVSNRDADRLAFLFLALVLSAGFVMMYHYRSDPSTIEHRYLSAGLMWTPLGNDHVRFSWLLCLAAFLAGWKGQRNWHTHRTLAWLSLLMMLLFVFFLHVLAARTGLFSFYLAAFFLLVMKIFRTKKRMVPIGLLVLLISLPVTAYLVLPSVRNRVQYIRYDWSYWRKQQYLEGSTDGVRLASIRVGWNLMQEHPLNGVGFGDLRSSIENKYDSLYPGMIAKDKILPSSEWMIYGAAGGWPGFILFTVIMLLPLTASTTNRYGWWILNGTAAAGFAFDIGLEVQYGVFLYAFLVPWCWRWWQLPAKDAGVAKQ